VDVEVLLGHMGGPLEWRDTGAWSVPNGEYEPEEDPAAAACREFEEELGLPGAQPVTSSSSVPPDSPVARS